MAAVEDEGSQSENKNEEPNDKNKGKPFSTMHQEIESKLTKPGISYEDRVAIILSGWDLLAGTASTGQLPFATFLYKWTLKLVLQGEWPRLEKIVKTRLRATLQRCTLDQMTRIMCRTLLPLVTDPWGHQTLKAIIADAPVSDEEVEQYIQEETWPVVRVRINTLVESRCEKLALSVLKVCIRYIRLRSNSTETLLLNSQEDHNHFVDLYFILLYKYDRNQFVEEIKGMDFTEGSDHVRRLLAQQEKGKVWKSRLKVAKLEIQIFVTSCIVKPFENVFLILFEEFCEVMKEVDVASTDLAEMVRTFLQISESSQHIYKMGSILYQKFGEIHNALVTELLIRALTGDMNAREGLKLQAKEETSEEQIRLEHQMAEGFMDLSIVFSSHENVARECVLTAFSLHPTQSRLDKLKIFGLGDSEPNHSQSVEENKEIKSDGDFQENSTSESCVTNEKEISTLQNHCMNDNSHLEQLVNRDNENLLKGRVVNTVANSSESTNSTCEKISLVKMLDTGQNSLEMFSTSYDASSDTKSSDIYNDNVNNVNVSVTEISDPLAVETNSETHRNYSENIRVCEYESAVSEGKNMLSTDVVHNGKNERLISKDDVWEFVDESDKFIGQSDFKNEQEPKVKEDVDSMDGFLATTEGLIEQLNQGKEIKTESEVEVIKEVKEQPLPAYDIFTDPQALLNQEKLGLSKELCDDLAVVLSYPRWQILSWMLEKSQLLSICNRYMNNVDSAKNVTKELKFLNIDYDQFKHLPSVEVDEFTGIEKGYEHFIEKDSDIEDDDLYSEMPPTYSSGSDYEGNKKSRGNMVRRGRRGRPPLRNRYFNSDSDSTGRSRCGRNKAVTSLSDTEDSEFESMSSTADKEDKEFEGKRVTAISSFDRRKRLRIDATTGKVRRTNGKTALLRLYRHGNSSELLNPTVPQQYPANHQTYNNCSLNRGSLNLNSNVVLNHYDRSSINNRVPDPLDSDITIESYVKTESTNSVNPSQEEDRKPLIHKPPPFQRGRYGSNWRYAGYVISKPQKDNEVMSTSPSMSSQSDAVRCSYRTREGRLVTLNTHNYVEDQKKNVKYLRKLENPTKFGESFAKFLMQQKSNAKDKLIPSITITKKTIPLEESLEYLKRQGTSVILKKNGNSTSALATAQKNVLNQIMSPENSRHDIVGRSDQQLPVRAIAMPVSHNPPNLPPSDKNNPTGLSRVLPKGTTVVRRPKVDTGAGPSGLNNGGTTAAVISRNPVVRTFGGHQPRPAISITPSNNFLGSGSPVTFPSTIPIRSNLNQSSLTANFNATEGPSTSFSGSSQTDNDRFSPLASAAVVGSVSQTLSPRLISNNSPGETQGSCFVSLNSNRTATYSNLSQAALCTTTTTVATLSGETRAPSMLETLLRDRSTPSSPLVLPISTAEQSAHTTTSISINEPITASSPSMTGSSLSASSLSEALNLVTSHSSSDASLPLTATVTGSVPVSLNDNLASSGMGGNINLGVSNIPVVGSSVLSSSLPVISSGVGTHVTVSTGGTPTAVESQTTGMHQLLLPAQFIQVQGSDGSTGLGIVHSGSLDLRLPPGTRVIKSSTSNMRPAAPVAISQSGSRPLNVLHNVKFVQNRQIVRTVVVPHSVALQSLGAQQTAQLVALSQGPGTSNNGLETQSGSKISSTQLQKMLGHNIVPGGLVIRAVRPPISDIGNEDLSKPATSTIIQHTSEVQHIPEKDKGTEKLKTAHMQSQEEGLAERLNRHYLKNALLATTSTQSVGTQTQTTAVKPVTGQLVNQVVMNHLRGIGGNPTISSIPVATTSVVANSVPSTGLSSLSLGSSNAVSSETLEQLREFESVFEKVSNKSVKDNETTASNNQPNFQNPIVSSEESMIAAQLLSMSSDTPNTSVTTAASNYIYTIPTTSSESSLVTLSNSSATGSISSNVVGTARLGEGTFITIPSSTQGGTLILVNPSAATSGPMTIASSVQTAQQQQQPPPAASPALSSTSSHSSIASSPSSTSSKSKSKGSKSKGASTPSSAPVTPTKPKSPPPPKAPPKPAVAKPQVEESDETKARIQAILDRYKQDLANTPQPQPAPRNRKNCPPPKNEGKSSNKKKSQVKKPDGTSSTSPCTSESGHLPSVSPSPAPLAVTPSGEDSDGSIGGVSVASSHFHSQDEKKPEESVSPQILQGVVVSNVKMDSSSLGNSLSTISQGRVVQLIRHGGKVTAITTRQPYQKSKVGLSSGGPPPNVTIQGRINMNELMESHLASLLAQGSATINQSSALITKLIQAQQQQSPSVQQLVVQTSGGLGQQVLQQVSLQPVITTAAKSQQIQSQLLSGTINIGDSTNLNTNSLKTQLQPQPSPVMSIISPSPDTPQQRVSSPSTPSPAPELPSTPPSFPTADDSNSSEDSNEGASAAPLPPFFTLTKQFMLPQSQQFSEKLSESTSTLSSGDSNRSSLKLSSDAPNSSAGVNLTSQSSRSSPFIRSSFTKSLSLNCPSTHGNSGAKSNISGVVMLAHSAPPSPLVTPGENVLDMSPASGPSSLENSPSLMSHRLPLVTTSELKSNSLDSVKSDLSVEEVQIPPSPATLTKQLQNAYMTEAALSPTVSHSHLSSSSSYSSPTTVQDLQSTSGEPRVIFPNLGHTSHSYSLAGQNSSASSLSNNSNCSASHNNPSMENNTLACLSSPSGDVYLDQAGVGLGLDSLPLVEGRSQSPSLSDLVPAVPLLSWSPRSADSIMDQSPSLNEALTGNMTLDVHHSEDSLCDSSTGFPGLFAMDGDTASASSTNSDDILSSTTNPCSISSASTASTVFAIAPSQLRSHSNHPHSSGIPHSTFGKRLPNHEQDHTVSSTRTENIASHMRTPTISQLHPDPEPEGEDDLDLIKQDESTIQEGGSWKYVIVNKNSNIDSPLSDDQDDSSNDKKNESYGHSLNMHAFINQSGKSSSNVNQENPNCNIKKTNDEGLGSWKKRRNQHQTKEHDNDASKLVKQEEEKAEIVHNGYEKLGNQKRTSDDDNKADLNCENKNVGRCKNQGNSEDDSHQLNLKSNSFKAESCDEKDDNLADDDKNLLGDVKLVGNSEDFSIRKTRGSKRRSDSDFVQEEKRSRSSRSRRPETAATAADLSPEEEKIPNLFEEGPIGGPITRSLRGRHISGTSDSSSNYSMDRVSTPGPQDSPVETGGGGSRRRKRRGSHDSSVSSRDGSPLTVLLNSQDGSSSGIHTRRSSSRDHAKKTRCRCCVDQQQQQQQSSSASNSGRRASGRVSRWSGPNTSNS